MPAIKDDKLVGALRWLIEADVIYKKFIEHENQGGREVWIVDNDGKIISHPISYHIGNDFVKIHKEKHPDIDWSSLERIMDDIKKGGTGTGMYDYQPTRKTFGAEKILIAYSSLNINNQQWTVGVTMNYGDISGPIDSQAQAIYGLAGLLILGSLFGVLLLYRSEKRKAVLEAEAENLRKIHGLEIGLCGDRAADAHQPALLQGECILHVPRSVHLVRRRLWHDAAVRQVLLCLGVPRPRCSRRPAHGCRHPRSTHLFQRYPGHPRFDQHEHVPSRSVRDPHADLGPHLSASAWSLPAAAPPGPCTRSARGTGPRSCPSSASPSARRSSSMWAARS